MPRGRDRRRTASNPPFDWRVAYIIERAALSQGDIAMTLRSLSEALKVSESHLGLLFKECTGRTFRAFLRELRIRHACELLSDPALSIKYVASVTSYKSTASFDRDFRAVTGMRPTDYRHLGAAAICASAPRHAI